MITLLHAPEITFSRDVQHVYRPLPLPGDSEETWAEYRRDWGRAINTDGTVRLSVRLDIAFTKDSGNLITALHGALRDVLLEATS